MSELIAALKHWKGRQFILQQLEEKGYGLPRLVQSWYQSLCPPEALVDLQRYWDEVLKERFLCLGLCWPSERQFTGPVGYRSAYLDALAQQFDFADPAYSRGGGCQRSCRMKGLNQAAFL